MTRVRVRNLIGSDLDELVLLDGARREVALGPLGPGQVSGWVDLVPATRYPTVRAHGAAVGDLVHLPMAGAGEPEIEVQDGEGLTYELAVQGGRLVVAVGVTLVPEGRAGPPAEA